MKKYFNATNIGTFCSILALFITIMVLEKNDMHAITNAVLAPFSESIRPGIDSSRLLHWFASTVGLIFYIFIAVSAWKWIKFLIKKEEYIEEPIVEGAIVEEHSDLSCGKEIAAMLDAIDNNETDININEKIFTYMNEFDKNVANIFELEQRDLKSFWVFEVIEDEAKNYVLIDINQVSRPTEEDKKIVKWSLMQTNPLFFYDDVKKAFKGENEEIAFVRNYGDFSLGYITLFKVKGSITPDRLVQLELASSYLMLLGKIDSLTKKMVKYIKDKEGTKYEG